MLSVLIKLMDYYQKSENIETMMYAQEAAQAILAKSVPMNEEEHRQLQKAVRTMLKSVGDRPN